ncbi:ABC transporter permease [Proteiniclasticum sp. QWL-01]|uniref:ABC transporter permease n=1 Tax=Proteiniclasticum sp. QWL-01 TaxID=3036945 RepID=UPI00220FEAB3|nr:ABC transporter permease [Proteiniclasticum sp. QWL-01]UUM11597.1 ABC transporter permease [Clostridiaceae bacterium HFYG-1003]WFF73077.1 ABC transporter permease [Proteiniclasticum sp. QWL-01]
MSSAQLIQLLLSAISFGTVIMYGAIGEILTEKSGNLNLGVPGIMYLGGIGGLAASFFYELNNPAPNALICLIISFAAAFLTAALGGLIYSFLTISLRANQNVTGLTLTIFGGGVANFFGGDLSRMAGGVGQISVPVTSGIYRANIADATNLGVIGSLFLSHGFMVYLAIILAILMSLFLNRTRKGLNLRSVGENPATADAAGINVTRYKYLATCMGAGISGLGGLYYTMDYIKGTWANDGTIESLGWLAVALVIFATWRSLNSIWGSYLFGLLFWVYLVIPNLGRRDIELYKMLPYLVTIAVLIFTSLRKRRENQPPASLGLPYFREER